MTTLASGIILYRRAPESVRLLLLRNAQNGHWGFAKGRRDRDDAHEVATALREVREETGYDGLRLHPGFRSVLDYAVQQPGGKAYGKRVTYFLARAPDAEPVLSREHDELLWADERGVESRLAFGQMRDLARAVFALLRDA
ncbi:MAG TPA: NUDIX domain-containing protein [Planctomycetota bacterium]|nr:NUDIX domain-containing protein [Planctomycetota bacterium]